MAGLWDDATGPYLGQQPPPPQGFWGDALRWLYGDPTAMPGPRPAVHPYDMEQAPYQSPRVQQNPQTGAVEPSLTGPSAQQAGSALYGMTGIPDMQRAYEAAQRGEYLPAIGQGGYGAASLLSLALPALRGGTAVAREGAPLVRDALAPVLADESGALRVGGRSPRGAITLDTPLPAAPALPENELIPGPGDNLRFSTPGLLASNPMPIPAGAETRLARKLGRTDPTIGAPNNTEAIELPARPGATPEEPGFPAVHIGPVSTQQWIRRNESLMTGDEIDKPAKWYEEALPAYQKAFGEEKAPAMMGAWLIANQNATPGFAQLSASRALEQYINKTRGMPESAQAGLADDRLATYWDAIQSGDPSKFSDFSTGQKIYDFVDSASGKNTRTFYGDDPRAGAPAVADVHTLRDTGTIDPVLHNWVAQKYGPEVAGRITPDLGSSPSETKYEWAADRMRQITDDLNAMKYRGRSDWTPAEAQAVGWMGMSKLVGRPGMTAESAIQSMQRNLGYELDFGEGAPWHQTFPEWGTLTPQEKATVSTPVLGQIMDYAKELTGAHENWRLAGTGAWKQDLNPAFRSQFLSSPEVVHDVANIVGYLGQQTATYGMRFIPSGKNLALAVHGPGLDNPDMLRNLWQEVYTAHPDLAGGFTPAQDANGVPGIHIGFPGGGAQLQRRIENELIPTIDAASRRLGITNDARVFRSENIEPTNDWTKYPDGRDHLQRLSARYGPAIQQRLDDYSRTQLEPALRREIEAAIRARGQAGGTGAGQAGAPPGAAPEGVAEPTTNSPPKGLLSY